MNIYTVGDLLKELDRDDDVPVKFSPERGFSQNQEDY